MQTSTTNYPRQLNAADYGDQDIEQNKLHRQSFSDELKVDEINVKETRAQSDSCDKKPMHFDDMDWLQNKGYLNIFFFNNLLSMVVKMKAALRSLVPLNLIHIPIISKESSVNHKSEAFYSLLESKRANDIALTPLQMWRYLMSFYTKDIIFTFIIGLVEIGVKMFVSISLNFCIQALIDKDISGSYWWAASLVFCMFIQSIFRHHSWTLGQNLNAQFRLLLVNTVYKKINRLSSHSIREANIGKVINIVSSDLNSTENKFFFLFQLAFAPFTLAAGCIVLAFRLGPLGLLSVAMLLVIFPLQQLFGKMQVKYMQGKTMKGDERIKLINDSVDGIRLIKMYGWEEAFRIMIERIRNSEVDLNKRGQRLSYIEKATSTTSVLIFAAITFIIIHYEGSTNLNSAKIFSTIEMLQYIKVNVMMFSGMGIGYIFELRIFLRRFLDIFYIKETEMTGSTASDQKDTQQAETHHNEKEVTPLIGQDEIAVFKDFSAFWKAKPKALTHSKETLTLINLDSERAALSKDQEVPRENQIRPAIRDVNFSIKRGELLSVVGKIGSGKTTLLQCLLREIPYFEGQFEIAQDLLDENSPQQAIAFVEQEPFIFSNNVRENILFGKAYDKTWYDEVVKRCCLLPDFKEMDKGDMTEIGEKGVNISGGQKARISLARAVYSKAKLYLLDDPLSAVDAKVAKLLFQDCIKGILKDKTVVLVTHQIHFTKNCDRVAVFEEGRVKAIGKFDQLKDELQKLAAGLHKFDNTASRKQSIVEDEELEVEVEKEIKKKDELSINKLVSKGKPEQTKVTFQTYKRFFNIVSQSIPGFSYILIVLFLFAELAFTAYSRSLGYYDSTSDDSKNKLFAYWLGFSFLYLALNIIKYIVLSTGALIGSNSLHRQMYRSLMRALTRFFDQTPAGALLNKFSNDVNILDNVLHYSANDALDIFANFLNLLITCCVINPYILIPGIVELAVLAWFLNYMKDIIVKSKQLDLQHKTPVYQFLQSTVSGIIPIKIYNQKKNFLLKMTQLCDNSIRTNMTFWLCGRFFGVFVQYITIFCSGVGVFIIIAINSDSPSLAGQSLTYLVLMTDSIQWCLRQILGVDSVMSSCERAYTLIDQESEAALETELDSTLNIKGVKQISKTNHKKLFLNIHAAAPGTTAIEMKKNWPVEGKLTFENVLMRYSKDLNPVLKGLTFEILPGEKVGCIGRTGAGKSSILQTLFRMTEIDEGKIMLDGIDISKLGLHSLRQNISIIPQIPFVFSGTIRRNIDPLNEYNDEQIWSALKLVELDGYVRNKFEKGIFTDMTDVSSVFSMGQKQLICLARAVLKSNKLIVLDEATANVDMETDNLIQKTIRTSFSSSSILTIAHRLNTIADYDKIIVMDDGRVAECDSPFLLLAYNEEDQMITRDTHFAQMVKHTGVNNASNIFNSAKAQYFASKKSK